MLYLLEYAKAKIHAGDEGLGLGWQRQINLQLVDQGNHIIHKIVDGRYALGNKGNGGREGRQMPLVQQAMDKSSGSSTDSNRRLAMNSFAACQTNSINTKSRWLTPDSSADPAQAELVEASIRLGGFLIRIGYYTQFRCLAAYL
jgi:hypothetical protein